MNGTKEHLENNSSYTPVFIALFAIISLSLDTFQRALVKLDISYWIINLVEAAKIILGLAAVLLVIVYCVYLSIKLIKSFA